MMKKILVIFAILSVFFVFTNQNTFAYVDVGLELSLLVDVSGSISSSEYNLQLKGYSDAFKSASVQNAIANNPTGAIAVSMIMWSYYYQQALVVPWTYVDASNATAFGDSLLTIARPFSGNTAPQSALYYAVDNGDAYFDNNNFISPRQVIDISGDGVANSGPSTGGREYALANGYDTINGLVIGDVVGGSVYTYYNNWVVGGSNYFLDVVSNFEDFGIAITNKLEREITPEPAAMTIIGLSIAGLLGLRRKFKN